MVEVPINVHVPPMMDAKATGINNFDAFVFILLAITKTGARKTEVTTVLLMKADMTPTVDMIYVNKNAGFIRAIFRKREPKRSSIPFCCSALLMIKTDARITVKSEPNPEKASAGVRIRAAHKSASNIRVMISKETLDEEKRTMAATSKKSTIAISIDVIFGTQITTYIQIYAGLLNNGCTTNCTF